MGGFGNLIFSNTTSHPVEGYKYIAYNRDYIDVVKLRPRGGGDRIYVEYAAYDSHVFKVIKLENVPRGSIPRRLVDHLNKILFSLVTENGYMPYESISFMAEIIGDTNFDTIIEPPKKRRRKVKNAKKVK